jgi:K+-sensing histidine kinase KdpD
MFERVMLNLMDNALRHGHARRMRVEAKEEMEALLISLEDDGDGIPEAKKDDLFTRSSASSHGYGLFLTREILNMTGIQIRETGSRGRGACFEMMVPPGAWRPIAQ